MPSNMWGFLVQVPLQVLCPVNAQDVIWPYCKLEAAWPPNMATLFLSLNTETFHCDVNHQQTLAYACHSISTEQTTEFLLFILADCDGWQDIKFIYMPLFLHNLYLVLIEPLISCMRWKSAATVISQCMVMATTAVFVFFFGLFVVSIPLSSAAWSSVLREKHGSVRKHTRMLLTSWNLQNFGAHKFGFKPTNHSHVQRTGTCAMHETKQNIPSIICILFAVISHYYDSCNIGC